jgi:hypothetical protein
MLAAFVWLKRPIEREPDNSLTTSGVPQRWPGCVATGYQLMVTLTPTRCPDVDRYEQ